MHVPDLVGLFITPLEHLQISYMITGGVASVVYGDPRFTRDIDIVLQLDPEDSDGFAEAFSASEFYVPVEKLRVETARGRYGHFNIIHRDVTEMLRISGSLVDRAAITEWVERLGVQEAWRDVQHEPPA